MKSDLYGFEDLRDSLDLLDYGICCLTAVRDSEGKIIDFEYNYVNNSFCELLFYSKELCYSHRMSEISPHYASSNVWATLLGAVETNIKASLTINNKVRNVDDHEIARVYTAEISKYKDGCIVIYKDITAKTFGKEISNQEKNELVNIEREIRQNNYLYRLAYEYSALGLTMSTLDFNYIEINDAFCNMVGYTRDELIGKTYEILTHPDDLKADYENANVLMENSSKNICYEKRYICKDGTVKWVLVNSACVPDAFGRTSFYIVGTQDITRIKELESELFATTERLELQTKDAIEASRLKGQFLANMSHELRTPLNSIIGFTNRVIKKSENLLPAIQIDNLKIVKDEALHLLDLINSLLDFAKLEDGKMEVTAENAALNTIITEVVVMMESFKGSKQLNFELDFFNNDISIFSDRIKIKQILINILSNAVKYSEFGTITIKVCRENDYYAIHIADQGVGIPYNELPRIFDDFMQVDGSYTRKVGGTGLGLSIVKKMVTILQGTVSVTSEVNVGSVFTVRLPMYYNAQDNQTYTEEYKNIVCIDNEVSVQELYKNFLEDEHYKHIPLNIDKNIINNIIKINPHAIILDVLQNRHEGWALLSEIKSNPKTNSIPVIIVSMLNESNLAYKMTADEYLVKPITQEKLISKINMLINKNTMPEVLVTDDDVNFLNLISQYLDEEKITYKLAQDGSEALSIMQTYIPNLLILDLMMPHVDGFTVLQEMSENPALKDVTVIVVTAKDLTESEKQTLAGSETTLVQKFGSSIEDVIKITVNKIKEKTNYV